MKKNEQQRKIIIGKNSLAKNLTKPINANVISERNDEKNNYHGNMCTHLIDSMAFAIESITQHCRTKLIRSN